MPSHLGLTAVLLAKFPSAVVFVIAIPSLVSLDSTSQTQQVPSHLGLTALLLAKFPHAVVFVIAIPSLLRLDGTAVDRAGGLVPGSDCESAGSVSEGNDQGLLGAALHHAGNADATAQQLVCHLQEPVPWLGDLGVEAAIPLHCRVGV